MSKNIFETSYEIICNLWKYFKILTLFNFIFMTYFDFLSLVSFIKCFTGEMFLNRIQIV